MPTGCDDENEYGAVLLAKHVVTQLVACNDIMKHTSGNLHKSAHAVTSQSSLVFEITRGRTDSPLRPINRDRFLIGAGERCDLRLGGEGMSAVHSVVHIDGRDIWLETLADSPEVRVNGRLTRSAALEPGDDLEIGSFSLTLHRTSSAKPVLAPRIYGASVSETLTDEELANPLEEIEELTARQLVDLIDQEEALIEEFEARRKMGAQALMDVVKNRFRELDAEDEAVSEEQPTPKQLLHELQSAIISLNEFAQEFDRRTERLSQTESQRVANSLLDFQQQVVSRLDGVLEKIAQIDQAERQQPPRRDVA
tara:strand:- start:161144 stop:162073 length:930 start_codon:yes stop_codon:yes gene_type:complete